MYAPESKATENRQTAEWNRALKKSRDAGWGNVIEAECLQLMTRDICMSTISLLTMTGKVLVVLMIVYVEAARAGGASPARIILSHIIPNTLGIILVNVTLNVSSLVIYQSTLSFIGLSLPAPAPEWGSMLSSARVDMLRAPTLVLFPALAIVLTAFSVNLLGDGLRDAMDPRLKS